ncbi:MAG: hypothetical protein HUU48_07195 [Flavobacteriales bacterium]|nr:hypothetical protein [Flavobacteriales bacterium]
MISEKKNDIFSVTKTFGLEHVKNNSKRILIFEQDGILWMDIQKKLESNGFMVHRAQALPNINFLDYVPFRSTVLRALSRQKTNLPNLVIADTDTSFIKELEKLKKQCRKKKLPIIYITSKIDEKIINERQKNAIGIFKKPVNSDTIIELINDYFKNQII